MSPYFYLILIFYFIQNLIAEDCSNFNQENSCQGSGTEYPDSWKDRKWQTPPRDHSLWRDSYQDMNLIVGYVQILYNSDKTNAQLKVNTWLNNEKLPIEYIVTYVFGNTRTSSNTFLVSKQDTFSAVQVSVEVSASGTVIAQLNLESIDLIWNNPKINSPNNYENGQKGAIIEMFGWPYDDIAKECEFIGKAGYLGIKVFPPQEAIFSFTTVENGELNPWYFIYQPVSYKLHSRSGNRFQLKNMIDTCRKNNVRVYADAVINHMTGNGNDMFPDHRNPAGGSCVHWSSKNSSAGSPWYTHGYQYQNSPFSGKRPGLEYPSVPYDPSHFHCERSLSSWTDPFYLNYGWLVGLADLKTESEYVRQRIADYLTDLLSIGFSGFRIDAAKHISPDNLSAIFKKLKDNLGGGDFPEDFISYLEVIIGGEKDLLMCNENNYNFGTYFEKVMSKAGLSQSDISKIKIWESDYPKEFPICGYWSIPSERYAIGLDCHDDQFPGSSSRDMGDKGSVLVKEKNVDKHRNFQV